MADQRLQVQTQRSGKRAIREGLLEGVITKDHEQDQRIDDKGQHRS